MALDHSIAVFARGLAFTRSFSRPYLASELEGIGWWLRDAPGNKRRRNDEWLVTASSEPMEVDRQARKRSPGGFLISAASTTAGEEETLRSNYRELGYRLWRTEWLMQRATVQDAPTIDAGVAISLVNREKLASRLAEAARGRLLLPAHLRQTPIPVRCHVALVGERIVGWSRSVSIAQSSWLASMFVQPEFRRRRIGGALLAATLRSDEAVGLSDSVLVANRAGAGLYAKAEFATIAEVLVFAPSPT